MGTVITPDTSFGEDISDVEEVLDNGVGMLAIDGSSQLRRGAETLCCDYRHQQSDVLHWSNFCFLWAPF